MRTTTTIFFLFFCACIWGQNNIDLLFQKADSTYFDYKDYNKALGLYNKIKSQLKTSDKDYAYTVDKIAKSIFYLQLQVAEKDNWEQSISLSNQFIDVVEKESKYIEPELEVKKYWMYKNIVVGYFGLDQQKKAIPYQEKLYQAHKDNKLPKGLNEYYCFEKFVYNNQNVWGYEWYANLGDKEAEGSFSKQVYYIYSRDDVGSDKEQLYTLETVKIHKLKSGGPDFVLTKRVNKEDQEVSQSIWAYTFANPVDYTKLHNAIVECLKGDIKTDTQSIIDKK